MKVKHIDIQNFHAIRNFNYECGEGVNVLIGVNGAGKSSFLQAIKILMSWFVARVRNPKGRGISLVDEDITIGEDFCSLSIEFDNNIRWNISKTRAYGKTSDNVSKSNFEQINSFVSSLRESENESMPVMAFYGVNRSVQERDIPLRLRKKHELSPLDVYKNTLDSGTNFRSFFEWFREREDLENEHIRDDFSYRDVQLSSVRRALESVFEGYGHFKVRRSPRAFVLEKNGQVLNFKQLSDGEKCYITLVGDLARKLSMANPQASCRNPFDCSGGIVMIDEVDLHLHPDWQVDILPNLVRIFPKCQFFVTTHSPFVVSGARTYNGTDTIVRLDSGIPTIVDDTFGLSVDNILTETFRVKTLRNNEVRHLQSIIWNYLQEGDIDNGEYKSALNELHNILRPSDIEFARIKAEEMKIKKYSDEKNQ